MANEAEIQKLVARFATMRATAALAVREHASDPRALFGAAMAFRLSGDYAAAVDAFERLRKLDSTNTHFLHELGQTQEYAGMFEAAIASYEAALAAEPMNYKARQALVQLQKQTRERNFIALMEEQFGALDADGWRAVHLGHALAKTYEDFGELETSFAWLTRGKAKRRKFRPYDAAREEGLADAAMRAPALAGEGHQSNEPIFVSGLPRSGTTLVDRILSSHPDVSSAGEIGNFALLHKRMTNSTTPATIDGDTLGRAGEIDFARLGKLYIESTRPLTGARPRFVDKAPSNYLLAPQILAALPNARVIAVRRHPLDSVLSNYKQIFPIDDRYYDYVYDLEAAAHKFVHFDRLLRHWQETLPSDRFMVLQYEDLVGAQEDVTRKLLAFAGLEWNDAALAFHRNSAGVGTPSAAQVRAPLYNSAMGRWAKYGALLDPARAVLERAGVAL